MFGNLARKDPLTGLVNRLGLGDLWEKLERPPEGTSRAVHHLDLDRFKAVNDQFGHPVGDQLLCAVADRLSSVLRKGDIAARMGGDEFVFIQASLAHTDEADLLARRIVQELKQPYDLAGVTVKIGVSVGYAISDRSDTALCDLILEADSAAYIAKRRGGGVAVYSAGNGADIADTLQSSGAPSLAVVG